MAHMYLFEPPLALGFDPRTHPNGSIVEHTTVYSE